jgi:hypothetical protein
MVVSRLAGEHRKDRNASFRCELLGVMKLLGHNSSDKRMKYLDIGLPDLKRELHSAGLHPRHLAPQPKVVTGSVRFGIHGVIDSVLGTQRNAVRPSLGRLSNRLTKILAELRSLNTKQAGVGWLSRLGVCRGRGKNRNLHRPERA